MLSPICDQNEVNKNQHHHVHICFVMEYDRAAEFFFMLPRQRGRWGGYNFLYRTGLDFWWYYATFWVVRS